MYTIAVKKDKGASEDYERYEVHENVYYYIRCLEVAMSGEALRESLREKYPRRFGRES